MYDNLPCNILLLPFNQLYESYETAEMVVDTVIYILTFCSEFRYAKYTVDRDGVLATLSSAQRLAQTISRWPSACITMVK